MLHNLEYGAKITMYCVCKLLVGFPLNLLYKPYLQSKNMTVRAESI